MARIITKELAVKIVEKLKAAKIDSKKKAHDEYAVWHGELLIGVISIRRASDKDLGHDFIPRELHIGPNQAKRLGQCPWSRADFIRCLQERGLVPPDDEERAEGTESAN